MFGSSNSRSRIAQETFAVYVKESLTTIIVNCVREMGRDDGKFHEVLRTGQMVFSTPTWLPVPKNNAIKGYTILLPKSLLKKNSRSMMRIGTIPSMGIVHLMIFKTLPNFFMSPENWSTNLLGKQLVQKPSGPLPKATCSLTSCG